LESGGKPPEADDIENNALILRVGLLKLLATFTAQNTFITTFPGEGKCPGPLPMPAGAHACEPGKPGQTEL